MKQGIITGISGPVIDVQFPEGSLPAINEALTVEANGQRYTMEVEQHLENKTVRCVMMAGSDGLGRVPASFRPRVPRCRGRWR